MKVYFTVHTSERTEMEVYFTIDTSERTEMEVYFYNGMLERTEVELYFTMARQRGLDSGLLYNRHIRWD